MITKKQLENMSLYTIASLYLDTYANYVDRIVRESDRKLNNLILDYIINDRRDEDYFFSLVLKVFKIKEG